MRPELVLVVPCYNEARRLDLDAWRAAKEQIPGLDLLFVDDGSDDDTLRLLRGQATLKLPRNVGKGEAVRAGMLVALERGAALTGYWDADLSTPLDELTSLWSALTGPRKLVMGARVQLLGRQLIRRAERHYGGRVFATAAALALGVPVYDTQCGAKLLVGGADTEALLSVPFGARWAFDVELIGRVLQRFGPESVEEVPLRRWHHREGSKVGLWDLPRSLWDLGRISGRLRAHAPPARSS